MTTSIEPRPRDRESVLSALRGLKDAYREPFGILELGIFGSFARGEATEASDLDLYVRTRTANPYLLVHFKEIVENRIRRKVDIVRLRDSMNPALKARIAREGIDV